VTPGDARPAELTTSLPDPLASRAVLIGSDDYRDMERLPAVVRNLDRLSELLGSPELWGLPSKNCTVLRNPASPAEVLDLIHDAAAAAKDTLVVYYAGHGLVDPHTDDLYLALPESSVSRLYSAVRFDDVRRELVTVSSAASKVVILDCCYSGRAMAGGMSGPAEMADQARIEGTYLMTASADTVKAQAPIGEEFTAFTGELVHVLDRGLLDGPDLLNLETLFWHVRKELVAKRRPVPQQRAGNDGGMIVLGRNRRGVPSRTLAGAAAATVPRALPDPPAGSEQLLRRPPREIADAAGRLAADGRPGEARQLLAAAAARRPDQEVASLIATLRQAGRDADAEVAISAIRERPAAQIAALAGLLRQFVSEHDADQLLDSVAHGAPDTVGASARILAADGRVHEVRRLLDTAIMSNRTAEGAIALVGALSSVGLGDEVGRLLDLAADGLTDVETAELGDALRGAGRDDAAFRLYSAARRSVALRPSSEVAALLRAMRDSGQDADADQIMTEICAAISTPDRVLDLAGALWAAELAAEADVLLDAAASLALQQVETLAAALRDVDRDDAALRLCVVAAAHHPAAATVALVAHLRDAGRPVDARRVLDSALSWPPGKAGDLVTALSAAGAQADTGSLLASAGRLPPDSLAQFMAALRSGGLHEDATALSDMAIIDDPVGTAALVDALARYGLETDEALVLDRASVGTPEYHSRLLAALRQVDARPAISHLLDWQAGRSVDWVQAYLAWVSQAGLQEDAHALLTRFAGRPVNELVELAVRLSGVQAQDEALAKTIAAQPVDQIAAALALAARDPKLDATPILIALAGRPSPWAAQLLARLQTDHQGISAALARVIAARWSADAIFAAQAELGHAKHGDAAEMFLSAIVAYAEDKQVLIMRDELLARPRFWDADDLLERAVSLRPAGFIAFLSMRYGPKGLFALWGDWGHMTSALRQIAEQRPAAEVADYCEVLKNQGYPSEARQLARHARKFGRQRS
jgi:Caspase domain